MNLKLDNALNLAKKNFKEGSHEEAKRIYQDILGKFPENKKAKSGLKALSGSPPSQLQTILDPPHDQQQLLINLYSQGKLQQLLDRAKDLLEQFPHSIVLNNICGAVYAGLKQYGAAIDSYKQALKIKPDFPEAYNNMGIALKNKGNLDAAIHSYEQALKIKPDYADAYYNMGNALKDKGELDAALESYEQALKIKPDNPEAYNNMGIALQNKGDLDAAIDSYKQALKIKFNYAEAHNNMGNALKNKGELDAAVESYEQALKIKPDYTQAFYDMGIALEKQDKLEEAIDLYKSAIYQSPKVYEHPNAFYRGQIYQKIWDFEGSSASNRQYFSQSGQDKIINEVFFKDYTSGFFLELGAYDGVIGSNCLFFEKFKNWDGIAIEASETQFTKLEKNRSCQTIRAVIGERVEEVEFVEVTQGLTQMSGINYGNYSRSLALFDSNEQTQIEKRTVITKTVDSILRKGMVVDFMSIDIEGNEMGVLNSIDFEKYEFRVICLENNIPEKQNFNEFLSKKGFCFFDRVGVDEIYYNKQYFDVFK